MLALTELDLVQMLDVDLATAAAVILAVSAAVAPPMRRVRAARHGPVKAGQA